MLAAFSPWNLMSLVPNELCLGWRRRAAESVLTNHTDTHIPRTLLVWKVGKGELSHPFMTESSESLQWTSLGS